MPLIFFRHKRKLHSTPSTSLIHSPRTTTTMSNDPGTEQNTNDVDSCPKTQQVTPQSLMIERHVAAALTADKGPATNITSWKVVDFTKKGDNYVCVVSSVKVKYELKGQSCEVSYIVKLNPCRPFDAMKEFTTVGFEKESKFYMNYIPALNSIMLEIDEERLKFPKCVYVSLEKEKEIIFFEDLRTLGYKMTDRRNGMDKEHTVLVVQELARLHAASTLLQNRTPDEDITDIYPFLKKNWTYYLRNNTNFKAMLDNQFKYSKNLLKEVGGYERAVAWIDNVFPTYVDILEEQIKPGKLKVVCHGDCWTNNLLFRYNEDGHPVDVMLLDLQLNNCSSPNTDLNFLLYTSTTGNTRRQHLDAFLDNYYHIFTSLLTSAQQEIPFTHEELRQDFHDKNIHGALFAVMLLPFVVMESDNVMNMDKCTDDDLDNMLQEMNEKSISQWESNPLIRSRFLCIFDELMETGLIP